MASNNPAGWSSSVPGHLHVAIRQAAAANEQALLDDKAFCQRVIGEGKRELITPVMMSQAIVLTRSHAADLTTGDLQAITAKYFEWLVRHAASKHTISPPSELAQVKAELAEVKALLAGQAGNANSPPAAQVGAGAPAAQANGTSSGTANMNVWWIALAIGAAVIVALIVF